MSDQTLREQLAGLRDGIAELRDNERRLWKTFLANKDDHRAALSGCYVDAYNRALELVDAPLAAHPAVPTGRQAGVEPAQAALEHDRTKVAECVTRIKNELRSYDWLITSRGSYEWNDDKWHEEFKRASEAIWEAIEPMIKIAADWSNCPTKWEDVQVARAAAPQPVQLDGEREKHVLDCATCKAGRWCDRWYELTVKLATQLATADKPRSER